MRWRFERNSCSARCSICIRVRKDTSTHPVTHTISSIHTCPITHSFTHLHTLSRTLSPIYTPHHILSFILQPSLSYIHNQYIYSLLRPHLQLQLPLGRCDEVRYNADQIVILDHSTSSSSSSSSLHNKTYPSTGQYPAGAGGGGTSASEPPPKLHWRSKRAELVRLSNSLQLSQGPVTPITIHTIQHNTTTPTHPHPSNTSNRVNTITPPCQYTPPSTQYDQPIYPDNTTHPALLSHIPPPILSFFLFSNHPSSPPPPSFSYHPLLLLGPETVCLLTHLLSYPPHPLSPHHPSFSYHPSSPLRSRSCLPTATRRCCVGDGCTQTPPSTAHYTSFPSVR